jgi:hypothetical protein
VHIEKPDDEGTAAADHRLPLPHTRTRAQGLDTQGEYDPRYTDLQTYWTYDLSDKVELGCLGIYSRNTLQL